MDLPESTKQKDVNFMSLALKLAKDHVGTTSPNPIVASLLVKNNKIISSGVTQKNGRPHSENITIKNATEECSGAVLYVTLEPCAHFGKTPPCVDLIIENKISRVVVATIDPDPRVNGLGIKKLKEAGIEVVTGILEKEAEEINRGFFHHRKFARPFVTLKLATSLDEKIFDKNSQNKWITNEKSREYVHYLRKINDAILVGAGTVKIDDPMLNCRIPGSEEHSPKRIIISDKLEIDLNKKIIQSAREIPTLIATSNKNYQKFLNSAVQIIECQKNENDQIDLKDLLKKLAELEIHSLLVEGGSIVASQFLKNDLVDELIWMRSSFKIGSSGLPALAESSLEEIVKNGKFKETERTKFDEDEMRIYLKKFDSSQPFNKCF